MSNQIMSNNLELNLTQFTPVMLSPLHHFGLAAKQVPIDNSKGVWANEIPLLGYISLRGNASNDAFMAAVTQVLGSAPLSQPCSLVVANLCSILWLAPDEWLLICPRERSLKLQQALQAALVGVHSQVEDNSGGFTSVLLQGKNARDALSHCTVYDLHALNANKVVGTTFGKETCYLHRQDDGYKLIFRRSFGDYIWRYLERAATPYGFGVAI